MRAVTHREKAPGRFIGIEPRSAHRERRSPWRRFLAGDWLVPIGAGILLLFLFAALFAPALAPADPYYIRSERRLAPPLTVGFPLGADELGRDILSRLIWGARVSLLVAVAPVAFAVAVGLSIGMTVGYVGGWLDNVVMRVFDVFFAFPKILLALGLAAALGPSLGTVLATMTIVSIPTFARLVRGLVLSARTEQYVEAARSTGAEMGRILARHLLPNILAPVIVYATLETGRNVILAASLSFLGLGVQEPEADWGRMLSTGRTVMAIAPHVATMPGLAIFLVTLSFNLIGDRVRDVIDPRMEA